MAVQIPVSLVSFKAASDLSAKQYFLVEVTAADTVGVLNATTDNPIGVLQNKPDAAGKEALVALLSSGGILKAVSDGSTTAIAAGDALEFNASGKLIKFATGTKIGVALEASTADGVVISFVCIV